MAGMDTNIRGSTSGNGAEVDANNNLKTVLPVIPNQAGFVKVAGELSASGDPVGLLVEAVRTSAQGRMTVGQPVPLMNEFFNNTTLNSAVFQAPTTTMTVTCAGGTLNLNASSINTLNTVARVSSYAHFPFLADLATYTTFDALLTQPPQNNCTIEMGFGIASASTAPTDGAFFRYNASGQLLAVISVNGAETPSAAITAPAGNVMHRYKIVVENDRVFFSINGAVVAIIATPTTAGFPVYSPSQPWFARVINGAIAPTLANQVKVGYICVGLQDGAAYALDLPSAMAIQGRHGSQGQTGHTMGSTALLTNSLAPGAGAAIANATAGAGALGLGGQFAVLPTLAANTDGILCSYQNPLPTAAIPGKTLFIRGVRIQSIVSTVLVGGPVLYEYSLCYGHTNVSLATTESATAKAPRRLPIGLETFAAAAAVGVLGSQAGQYMAFLNPIAVLPGEFVAIAAKNIGTVTSSGVIMFIVTFDAVFI
jgi:hypothetical protein